MGDRPRRSRATLVPTALVGSEDSTRRKLQEAKQKGGFERHH